MGTIASFGDDPGFLNSSYMFLETHLVTRGITEICNSTEGEMWMLWHACKQRDDEFSRAIREVLQRNSKEYSKPKKEIF